MSVEAAKMLKMTVASFRKLIMLSQLKVLLIIVESDSLTAVTKK